MRPPTGVATGIGSLPGTDPAAALRAVLDNLPDLPHLPELPDRGPGADLIGRSGGLLIDLPMDLQPSGWRMVPRPGRDLRRTMDLWARDLDTLQQVAGEYDGWLKVQVAGPWTLAAGIELHRGDRMLADPAACADLAASLAEGIAAHLADIAGRLPAARVVLQLDEPSLPAVLAARVPTASGFGTLRAVDGEVVSAGLRTVLAATGRTPVVLHCCAADPPFDLLEGLDLHGLAVDLTLLGTRADEALGRAVEAGRHLFLGAVPGTDAPLPDGLGPIGPLWNRLGFPADRMTDTVVVTPSCGLAGAAPAYAVRATASARAIAGRLGA